MRLLEDFVDRGEGESTGTAYLEEGAGRPFASASDGVRGEVLFDAPDLDELIGGDLADVVFCRKDAWMAPDTTRALEVEGVGRHVVAAVDLDDVVVGSGEQRAPDLGVELPPPLPLGHPRTARALIGSYTYGVDKGSPLLLDLFEVFFYRTELERFGAEAAQTAREHLLAADQRQHARLAGERVLPQRFVADGRDLAQPLA
ncbi:MAG: hypothetical protein IPK80_19860 [Nannocystis sp.]|nr:hypothetical protein [Nannocystis sp.]